MNVNEQQHYVKAKTKVRKIKIFYIHLVGYIVLISLVLYNLYIIEEGRYKDIIVWLNLTTIVTWSICLAIHAWCIFGRRLIFKKSWEDRKIEKFLKKEEKIKTTFWE